MDQGGMVPWRPASSHFHELTPKQRREEDLLQPFYEEQKRQDHVRRLHQIKNLEAACQMRDHRRILIHKAFQNKMKRQRIKELYEVSRHASLLISWDTLENQDFATKVDVFEKMRRELDSATEMDRCDFENEVRLFESKGFELGVDTNVDMSIESNNKEKLKERRKDTSKVSKEAKFPKKLKLDGSSESTQDGNVLSDIKERVQRAEKEKFELEQKRRMDAVETEKREMEMEEFTRKREEEERLMKLQEDQALKAKELEATESSEKEKLALRLELEQQIAEQRSREWEAVLARDHEMLLMMKHDRDNEVSFEQRLWQEERQRKLEQRQIKHRNLCREVLLQIINLAESSAMYKLSTNCVLSSIEWWEWKNLFVRGAILPVNLEMESVAADTLSSEDKEVAEKAAVMDYINEQGEWKFFHPIGTNRELGSIIYSLFRKRDLDPCPVPPPYLSHMQLKLAVLGTPFAGKTFVAKLLEEKFGVVRLEIEKIIASAIAEASIEEEMKVVHQQCDDQGPSVVSPLEQPFSGDADSFEGTKISNILPKITLGQQARAAVLNGLQVPDEVTVQLLLHTLESLHASESETAPISPKDIKKKGLLSKEASPRVKGNLDTHHSQALSTPPASHRKAAKEKGAASKDVHHTKERTAGFILDGFPSTLHQAEVLQRGLSGLKLTLESKHADFVSLLAPPPCSDSTSVKHSYPLDALFVLDPLEEGDALKQAMGKYVDPKTGLFYHLEFTPPPENDRTGIVSRLKPIEDVTAAGKRIKDGMSAWNVLFEWITTFSNVHVIHHDDRKRFNLDETHLNIQALLDAKLKISAAADAAKAAVESEEAATRAACEAEKASSQAKTIAQKLFLAKSAEIEALTILERSSNDPTAKDILKKKVSESTSHFLQEAAKSVKEAEASAAASKKAAEDALQARHIADEAVSSVSAAMQAREQALSAAESAKASAAKAAAAYQKAQLAADSASSNLADTTNLLDNSDRAVLKQRLSDLSAQPIQNAVETPLMPENFTNASEDNQCCAESLCKLWHETEGAYLSKLREFFSNLRLERKETQRSLIEIKGHLAMFLKRQDERQACLDDFQGKYNRVDGSQRSTSKMKKQLQKKADDFFQKLYSISEEFLKEAQVNCQKNLSMWMKQREEALSECFTLLIRIEMERFLQTCCLLFEYFLNKSSSDIKNKFSDGASSPSPRSKQAKNLPPLPGWLPSIASALPRLHQVLEQTIIVVNAIAKATMEPQNSNPNQLVLGNKVPLKSSKGTSDSTANKETSHSNKLDQMSKVVQDETQLLLFRFERLASKACSQLSDLEELLEATTKQINKWVEDLRKVKNETTGEIMSIVQEAIEEGIPLWFYMCLDGNHLGIDESKLQLDPPRPLGLQTLPDLSSCHYQVLEELVETFQKGYVKGYVSLPQATEAVFHAVEAVHTMCKNDPTLSMIPRVPGSKSRPGGPFEVWNDYTREIVKVSSASSTQFIDWRSFCISLIDAHFHNFVRAASVEDILKAHIDYRRWGCP